MPRNSAWCAVMTVVVALSVMGATDARAAETAGNALTRQARLDAIRRAQVWTKTDIPAMDIKAGPRGPLALEGDATVDCSFVERPRGIGSTLKFRCAVGPKRQLKVRYGDRNGEVFGQVAATRLLWALGFGADRMYPARVVCRGCTASPYKQKEAVSTTTVFDPATIDVNMKGKTLEVTPDQGWSWKELDLVDDAAGGAPVAQRDALKLLAVLIQHGSNKSPNQRLLCLDKQRGVPATTPGVVCTNPFMMLTDVGKTFGRANEFDRASISSVNFRQWSQMPVWKDPTGCVGNLPRSMMNGTLDDPQVGEPGRAFLAGLLTQLTDTQLHDLFTVARFTQRDPTVRVDDWVNAFKAKRAEIVNRRCAS